ncbi:MAG: transposase [Coriobacteriales bacterium]|nr:transposase [Coriobacteriales bacterium]
MPHQARRRSGSGYYHVVSKGINGQDIFECDADRRMYRSLLGKAREVTGVLILAYCLMSNHVHLVLDDPQQHVSDFVKYVHERYGAAYCRQYDRVGGIFVKKFWSEPIETDSHLLCAVRYVHANPANAGICKAAAYEWSSAKDYLGRKGFCDTNMVLDMCGGVEGFVRFSQPCNATFLPFPGSKLLNHLSDEEARSIATDILGHNPSLLASKQKEERNRGISLLRERGFPVKLIVRLTGIGKYIVSHAT